MHLGRTERMNLGPSRCFLCSRTDGPAIDTGIQRPAPVGHVYICLTSCVPDIIRLEEGLTANAASQVVRGSADVRAELAEAKAEIERLKPFEQAIARARDDVAVA